jgi:hypothetical protein
MINDEKGWRSGETMPPWSYSALDCFDNVCPEQYYHRYILKERAPETEQMLEGTRVHEMLEQRVRDEKPLPAEYQQHEPLARKIHDLWHAAPVAYVEHKMGVTPSWNPCDFFASDVWGRGVADILIVQGSTAAVFDWKTGKVREKNFQLAVMAAMVFAHFPQVTRVVGANVWLAEGRLGQRYEFHRVDLGALHNLVQKIVDQIQGCLDTGLWPKRRSGLCGWCQVKTCEHNRSPR